MKCPDCGENLGRDQELIEAKEMVVACLQVIEGLHDSNKKMNTMPMIRGVFDNQLIVEDTLIKAIRNYLGI